MVIAAKEKTGGCETLLRYLPPAIRLPVSHIFTQELEEIRLRLGLPLTLQGRNGTYFVGGHKNLSTNPQGAYITTRSDIDTALELISRGSVYSLEDEIRQGYITVSGGHRIGLCGKAVIKDGAITYLKEISGLNYRFAKEIIGAADCVIDEICGGKAPCNTLLISPPQCGKTTMLRDICRLLSYRGYKICVVDERCEIAGMAQGISSFDMGPQTDVLDACPKAQGMLMALRSMSPQILITDEIGTQNDYDAICSALSCGVSVITSIHGSSRNDLYAKSGFERFGERFDCIVTLSKRRGSGTVEEIYRR